MVKNYYKTTLELCEKDGFAFVVKNKSGEYLRGHTKWTKDIRKARIFFRTCDAKNSMSYCNPRVVSKNGYSLQRVRITLVEEKGDQ
jgi:hypothetical protein